MMGRAHRQRGVVLLVVLFFAVLLTGSIATFMRRATVDSMIVRNREGAARAEALARGGIRLATALLVEDRVRESASDLPIDSYLDGWARARNAEIEAGGGATLRLRIEDSGARLNLNALFGADDGEAIERWTGFTAAADVMRATLAHLDTVYGGVREYLEQAGLSPTEIQQLKDRLRS